MVKGLDQSLFLIFYGTQIYIKLHILVNEERLRHRRRIGEASRLDHNVVQGPTLLLTLHQLHEDRDQVDAHSAADAAVVHLEDVLLCLKAALNKCVVHAHFTELSEQRVEWGVRVCDEKGSRAAVCVETFSALRGTSFSITAIRLPWRPLRIWLSRVVFPLPR